ncbi:MAG: hypothetical protein RIF32_05120 [Leptospirales bacterium]|jgi:hypothetical protein
MKAWEPEEIFEKADFPAKKPGSKSGSKAGKGPPGQGGGGRPPRNPTGGSGSRGASKKSAGVPGPPPTGRPSPQRPSGAVWEPDLDFERADFSGIPPEEAVTRGDSRSSSDAMANVAAGRPAANPSGGPQARTWQPPKLSERARKARDEKGAPGSSPAGGATPGTAQTPKVVASRIRQGPGAETPVSKPAANAPAGADPAGVSGFSRRLLEELVILHRENARHILRHWYWEKAGMAPEGLGHIQPHDRIYIVLSSLGPQVLIVMYESMSPTERRQMQEILNQPRNVTAADVSRVRTVFMNMLRAEV